MANELHERDVELILSKRHDNGDDFWSTADGRVYVGNPFSTIGALLTLHELGVGAEHEAVAGGLERILAACRDDGKIRLAPKAPLYPCYTSEAARTLCRFGLSEDPRVRRTIDYLLASTHEGGGWRCSFSRMGKGPETQHANPGATLLALDTLRHFPEMLADEQAADHAVDFLLAHWETRKPLGPCHWGIGTLFLQTEYPFLRYNLFFYVYVLSYFDRARRDARFRDALSTLEAKCDADGRLVVERPHRAFKELSLCRKGAPSALASARLEEIRARVA